MAKRPKKPAAKKPTAMIKRVEETTWGRTPEGFVRNIDIPVGRETPPPGSMLKKPKGAK